MSTIRPQSVEIPNSPERVSEIIPNKTLCPEKDSTTSWKFRLNMISFLLIYTMGGAYIFQLLERRPEEKRLESQHRILLSGRLKLLDAVANMGNNTLSNDSRELSEKWNAILQAVREYEATIDLVLEGSLKHLLNDTSVEESLQWNDYLHVYFFVLTLISTIGYGNLAPRTTPGRIFCVLYAVIGIPVLLVFIAQAGKLLAQFSKRMLAKIFGSHIGNVYFSRDISRARKIVGTSISLSGVVTLLFIYMAIGGIIVDFSEQWGFINSFYFCFITLTTVGFGDLVPNAGKLHQTPYLLLVVRTAYTLIGLAVTSTAISLIQTHYSETWAKVEKKMEEEQKHALKQISNITAEIAGRKCMLRDTKEGLLPQEHSRTMKNVKDM